VVLGRVATVTLPSQYEWQGCSGGISWASVSLSVATVNSQKQATRGDRAGANLLCLPRVLSLPPRALLHARVLLLPSVKGLKRKAKGISVLPVQNKSRKGHQRNRDKMLSTVIGSVNLGYTECAGFSRGAFKAVSKSDNQSQCPKCTISCHHEEIQNLKSCLTDPQILTTLLSM